MLGLELAVEQREPARLEACDQPGQRDLRRVAHARHHRFAEKGTSQRKAVQPAGEPFAVPDFDRMREAALVQRDEHALYRAVDPGVGPIVGGLCAKRHDAPEIPIGSNAEAIGSDCLAQRARQMELVERQHSAQFGLDPIDAVRVAMIGHREHPHGIGAQHQVRVEFVRLAQPLRHTR